MISYVKVPNLPEGRVEKIICGTKDRAILDFFISNNITVIAIDENTGIDPSVSTHVDMAALHLGCNEIIVDKAQIKLKNELLKQGFDVLETTAEIKGDYPNDVALNFALFADKAVGNFKYADKALINTIKNSKQISVNQGYCKCSMLIVNEHAIITDDASIHRKMSDNGFDSLFISKGDILLFGHEYGFIGGASGKISKESVLFFGDITMHRNYYEISEFLKKHGCNYVCSDNKPLRDIGGIIPLTEIK